MIALHSPLSLKFFYSFCTCGYSSNCKNIDDFGLMLYNVRWYDPYLNHFTQPDTIVPDTNNVTGELCPSNHQTCTHPFKARAKNAFAWATIRGLTELPVREKKTHRMLSSGQFVEIVYWLCICTWIFDLPLDFARYIASSASRKRSSG